MNRAALHELELDAADKFRALSLDSAAHHMTVSSRGLNFHLGIENVDNTYEFLVYFYKLISMNNQIYFKFLVLLLQIHGLNSPKTIYVDQHPNVLNQMNI